MADPQTAYSFCHNPPLSGKDELVGIASIKSSNTHTFTPTVSYALIPIPVIALHSTNELFKWFIKVYLEAQTQPT